MTAFLGVDLGSVSTDLVLLDAAGELISSVYLPTRGRPVDVLLEGLSILHDRFPAGLTIAGCGTTGSGRHLAARLLGADVVKNEITCQTLGARRYVPGVDTILEIGGQDSKFVSLRHGMVADFAMNKICAAGTGSFLEEQARELGVAIVGDFADRAFAADAPLDLGTRCTVFMETEVVNAVRGGAAVENICAGLAHSIVRNYLEKVVGSRRIGDDVVFQGGVASNDSVVAAFEAALGRRIHVHPFNRISGAIGAALAAIDANRGATDFRDITEGSRPSLRSFECTLCSNRCDVNVVEVDGKRAWFGDTCERYTSRSLASDDSAKLPPNLAEEYVRVSESAFEGGEGGLTIGIPRASTVFGALVFWATFFKCLGHRPVLSDESSDEILKTGLKHLSVGVCLPIKLTAGHVHSLIARGVDYVFVPSVVLLSGDEAEHSFSCPYAMAVPFIISTKSETKFLSPVISMNDENAFLDGFAPYREVLGASRGEMQNAFREAMAIQEQVDGTFRARADALFERRNGHAFAILGKPYNTLDPYMNLSLFERLRRSGVLAIPQKLLTRESEGVGTKLPWRYSTDIHEAASVIAHRDDLHPVVVSNFGCGPDAFTFRGVEETLASTPHLFLEFDEHRGEAGLVTRIEAFLDQLECDQPPDRGHAVGDDAGPAVPLPGSTVRLPFFADQAYAFSGLLQFTGCDARVLPLPDAGIRALGERHSLGKECHAYSMLAGDLVALSREPADRPVTFFFPGTSLPCLLHEYGRGMRMMLRELGIDNISVCTPSSPEMFAAYSIEALERFYLALMSIELLVKAVCQLRPYERDRGMADAIHAENLKRVEDATAGGDILAALDESLEQLALVATTDGPRRPIVGIAGDVYTKTNAAGNDDLFRWLEDRGLEVWPAPFLIDLLDFGISRSLNRSVEQLDVRALLLSGSLAVRRAVHQWRVKNVVDGRIERRDEPDYAQMKKLTARYMSNESHELLFINVTKIVDFAQRGADGIINAICFNCMVGNASAAIVERIRRDFDDIPIISAVYSGGEDPSRRMGLEAFVAQTQAFHRRKAARPAAVAESFWPKFF